MSNQLIPASMDKDVVVNPRRMMDAALEFQQLLMMYESGIKQIKTKLQILEDEFSGKHKRNPISTISSRIKDPMSIAKKLQKKGLDVTVDNMVNELHDIAGIRVTCPFISDVYHVTNMLLSHDDIKKIELKDYIKNINSQVTMKIPERGISKKENTIT